MALLIWGIAAPLMAQGNGAVTGLAIGQQGERLAGYTIAIEDLETHHVYKTKTNEKGAYVLLGLPLHVYNLTLEDASGKEWQSINGQSLADGGMTTINFDLKHNPGASGGAPRLNSVSMGGPQITSSKGRPSKRYPKNAASLVDRAQHEASAGQLAQAGEDFQKAIQLAPPDANLENDLGVVYAKLNNFDGAVQAFQKAADLDPRHAGQFYFNMGAVQVDHNQMDAAAQAFKKCVQADPKFAEAYFWLGQALVARAQTLRGGKVVVLPGTVEAFETYLKLSPNAPDAGVARQILQTITQGADGRH
jgi:tetratricopeptide (TPR) repeat protein